MKKYILLTIIALGTLWSCQTDEQYEDYNRDPKNPTSVAADFLFTDATVRLTDQMVNPNVNRNVFRFFAQYFTTTTYVDEPNYELNTRNIPQNHWSILYRNVLLNLQDARGIVEENEALTETQRTGRLAQLEVIEVYAWHVLVDTFGDIPYSEALNAVEFPLPAYEDDAAIYANLISRLDAALPGLDTGTGFSNADVLYNGDMEQWAKFGNSLKLRLGMRLTDVNPSLAQSTAESAISGGVFTSNADNATLEYQSAPPHTNPLWDDLVQSGRSDYLPANTIVDIMNDLNDPRRDDYFQTNQETFIGGIYGGSNSFPEYSHVGDRLHEATNPGILLDYAEVEFHLAEAAKLGYSGTGSAEEHYNAAITASILYWGGTPGEAAAYLSESDVAYDNSDEQLATQFWIAMYDNPFQGWSVWRKFDAPELNVAAESGDPVPLRYTYPVNEQNLNLTQYEAASSAIGGDEQQTPVFWDVQ